MLDTGASSSITPFPSDSTPTQYGLIHAETVVDLYALITGEDTLVDLSPPDTETNSDFDTGPGFELITDLFHPATALHSNLEHRPSRHYELKDFGAATSLFIYPGLDLINILVEPNEFEWILLPRWTPPESYFHCFGLSYIQAFALFHTIPIWTALVLALLQFE